MSVEGDAPLSLPGVGKYTLPKNSGDASYADEITVEIVAADYDDSQDNSAFDQNCFASTILGITADLPNLGPIADNLLSSLTTLGASPISDGVITDGNAGGTNGRPFQFNAVGAAPTDEPDTALAYAAETDFRPDNASFNFTADLGRLAERIAGRPDGSLGADLPGTAAMVEEKDDRRIVPWVTGKYTDFVDDDAVDRDGYVWAVTSGVSVRLNDYSWIGLFGRYRAGEVSSVELDSELESRFLGGGGFVKVGQNGFNLIVGGLYEYGLSDIVTAGDTGDFNSQQWTVEGRAEKRFQHGHLWWEPGVNVLYSGLDRDAYTDSGGNEVASSSQLYGRVSYGSKLGITSEMSEGRFNSFASINGNWNFQRSDDATLTTGEVLTSEVHSLSLGGGAEYVATGGLVIRSRGDWFTAIGGGLTGWTVSGGIGMPLAVFGLHMPGALNLDMSGNLDAAAANANLTVPLN